MHFASYNIRGRTSFGVVVGDGIVDLNYLPAHATIKGEVDTNLDGVADEPGRHVSDWRKQA